MTLFQYLRQCRGRASHLAACLAVSPALVSMWAHGSRRIPAERCRQISALTGVPLKSLRPDCFGRTPR
jgi:DNA-binding transcriptional regulator YdaS (Cro superfamily)